MQQYQPVADDAGQANPGQVNAEQVNAEQGNPEQGNAEQGNAEQNPGDARHFPLRLVGQRTVARDPDAEDAKVPAPVPPAAHILRAEPNTTIRAWKPKLQQSLDCHRMQSCRSSRTVTSCPCWTRNWWVT